MKCPKCKRDMLKSKALQNTPEMGLSDFSGDTMGCTMSMTGPVVWVDVLKCPECGLSKHE
jgi:hypothetical protein